MTGEEYISLTRKIIPVIKGRYEDIIRMIFEQLSSMECFKKSETRIDLKIISSTSIFSEVVHTKPEITVIWDNYQWEILEKFLLSSLLYLNKREEIAMKVYKMSIYAALSIRLTHIAPELSYIFSEIYRDLKKSMGYKYIGIYSTAYTDMLYCQMLALGHEFAHILFEHMDFGTELYNMYSDDFLCIMDGAINSRVAAGRIINEEKITIETLIREIKLKHNEEYRKELICDILSYYLIEKIIEEVDQKLNIERQINDLYDDVISMNDYIVCTMDSFSYILEYWVRFGSLVSTKRNVRPEDLHCDTFNFAIWKNQYYARETLVSLYKRVTLLRDKNLYVPTKNKKHTMLYNAFVQMNRKLLTFEDKEWAEIICKWQSLMNQNIDKQELLEARNDQLGIE